MKLKVVIHEAEEGGCWAEAPSLPGCVAQGACFEELLTHLYDVVEGVLAVELDKIPLEARDQVMEIAV